MTTPKNDAVNDLNEALSKIASAHASSEMMAEIIWGAAATTTRAFEKVSLRVDANTCRIFISVRLRWWARFKRFKLLKDAWLKRAERRCQEHAPSGWKLLVYYTKESL